MALAGGLAVFAIALLVVVSVASVAYAIATVYLLGRLQTHHPRVYEDLGKPGVYVAKWYDWIKVIPFLWRQEYLAIPDASVTRSGMCARTTLIILACGLIMFFLLLGAFGE
jgi:hypothetical protein